MGRQVFVCYSRKDEDFVLKLAWHLKNKGVPIWLDQRDIPSGANWDRTIEKALNECASLLLVLSPSSVESDEVQSEWRWALDEKKVVVPILYQPCRIPFRLKPIQYIDFTSRSPDDKEALEQILNALGIAESSPIKPVAQPERPPESLLNGSIPRLKMQGKEKLIQANGRGALAKNQKFIITIMCLLLILVIAALNLPKTLVADKTPAISSNDYLSGDAVSPDQIATLNSTKKMDATLTGVVKLINKSKRFGFIAGDNGKDYFFNETSLNPGVTLIIDDKVCFKVAMWEKGPVAKNVSKDCLMPISG
jgi:cold shock CspA family protein